MFKEVKPKEIENILQKYFETYKANDIYEKILIYEDKKIKGIISYSIIYERAEINYIVTINEYRKQGIGTKLLNEALKNIIKSKCKIVSLEVNNTNTSAINLYLKQGFVKKAIRKNYYKNGDALLMIKELVVKQ